MRFVDHLPVFVMLSHLFIAALWSPAGKGLSFVMFNCVFVTFPYGILGRVWFLIVSIPDLCHLSYLSTCLKNPAKVWMSMCRRTLWSDHTSIQSKPGRP